MFNAQHIRLCYDDDDIAADAADAVVVVVADSLAYVQVSDEQPRKIQTQIQHEFKCFQVLHIDWKFSLIANGLVQYDMLDRFLLSIVELI